MAISKIVLCLLGICILVVVDASTTSIHWPTINNNPYVNWSPKPQLLDCVGNPAERSWPPSDYELCPDLGYYKLHAFGASWQTARQVCEEEGAHLVIVNSPAESDFLKKLMAKYPNMPESVNKNHVWMGIRERGTHGKFFTIFGDKLEDTGFVNWETNPNQPNDPTPDDCATFFHTGVLFDDPCNVKYGFVCEIELSLARSVIARYQVVQGSELVCNDRVCPHVETDSEILGQTDDIDVRGNFGSSGGGGYGGSGGPAVGRGGAVSGHKPSTAGVGSHGGIGGPAVGLGGPVSGNKPIAAGVKIQGGSGRPAGGLGGPVSGNKPIAAGVGSHGGVGGSTGGVGSYGGVGYGSGGYDDSLPRQKANAPLSFYWPKTSYGNGRARWSPQARKVECATSPADCTWPPKDYELYTNMGYYKFYAYGSTWSLARETCEEDGAHLVILNSEKEAAVVRNLSMKYPTSVGAAAHDRIWVGAHARGVKLEFYTIFGDPLQATGFWRWGPDEPGDGGVDDCVFIKHSWGLGDWAGHNKIPFICEIELSQVDARRRMLNNA